MFAYLILKIDYTSWNMFNDTLLKYVIKKLKEKYVSETKSLTRNFFV